MLGLLPPCCITSRDRGQDWLSRGRGDRGTPPDRDGRDHPRGLVPLVPHSTCLCGVLSKPGFPSAEMGLTAATCRGLQLLLLHNHCTP